MFHKFKKGIFIQIKNGQVITMLPFSKHNYVNEWSDRIRVNVDVIERAYAIEGRRFNKKYINKHTEHWYCNNALIRYEYPIKENDSGVGAIYDMFLELCKKYPDEIPDMEFFVNKRDHPLFRIDENEPYDYIYDETPLISHSYDTYCPLLSMCGGDEFADILIPTWEDWARVSRLKQKYFPKSAQYYRTEEFDFSTPFSQRIPTAVFRGSSTGMEVDINKNMRLKIATLSLDKKIASDGIPYLNAGITSWNARPRINKQTKQIETLDHTTTQIPLIDYMDICEQSKYKYIVNIDGHVSAYRLSLELNTGSVILLVKSRYRIWYTHLLQPYIHYVPVKSDLSDLYEQIDWCKSHDTECEQIAQNARHFYNTYLIEDKILEYLKNTLQSLKLHMGDYQYNVSPYEHLKIYIEPSSLPNDLPKIVKNTAQQTPPYGRTYDFLQGCEWYFRQLKLEELILSENADFNRNSKLNIYKYNALTFLSKQSEKDELLNEAMIGIHCINPLLKQIPHFSYTFDYRGEQLFTEYFEHCETFFDYLRSEHFNIQEYCNILCQIAFALHTAQQSCLFMHCDLYPWNILIQKQSQPIHTFYLLNPKTVQYVKATNTYTPIIIDYGKSNGIIQGCYYGKTNPFKFSSIHDILCILISSLHILINFRTLSKKELKIIFQLSDFFSGGQYTNNTHFKTIKELKQFLSIQKKYATMLDSNKYELEEKTPLDLIFYMLNHNLIHLQNCFTCEWTMREMTSLHAYEYLCASNDEERSDTYKNVLQRINNCILYEHNALSYEIFNHILKSIQKWSLVDISDTLEKLSPLQYTILQDKINIPLYQNTLRLTETLFETKDNLEEALNFFKSYSVSGNLVELKQILLEYISMKLYDNKSVETDITLFENVLSLDNIRYLQWIANQSTFFKLISLYLP
jgi:hypothetical protein